jgi:hypothetical protein
MNSKGDSMSNNQGVSTEHPMRANADKIAKLAEPIYQLLNIQSFSYARFYWNKTYFSLGSRRDIDDYYWGNNLNEIGGPMLDLAFTPSVVMISEYANPDSEYAKRVVEPIREKFGLEHFVAYLKNYLGYSELIIFGATKENTTLLKNFYTHKKAINQFIRYFKYKGKDIIESAKKNKLKFALVKSELTNSNQADQPADIEAKDCFLNAIKTKRFYLDGVSELQCLNLAVKGYTFKKIAAELFLSARTVEAHINSVRNKLGIKSKKDISPEVAFNKELTALIKEFDASMKKQNSMANYNGNSSVHISLPHKLEAIVDPMFFDTDEANKLRGVSNHFGEYRQKA